MSTGLDVFDRTVQKTNLWLKDIMEALAGTTATRRGKVYAPPCTLCAIV
jgi:hypothetical protein